MEKSVHTLLLRYARLKTQANRYQAVLERIKARITTYVPEGKYEDPAGLVRWQGGGEAVTYPAAEVDALIAEWMKYPDRQEVASELAALRQSKPKRQYAVIQTKE